MATYLGAVGLMAICFLFFGVGILFFGRKNISAECGTVPGQDTNKCLSKEAGICPVDDKEGYLKMATIASRARKQPASNSSDT